MIIQIYEIKTAAEGKAVVDLGVDQIGIQVGIGKFPGKLVTIRLMPSPGLSPAKPGHQFSVYPKTLTKSGIWSDQSSLIFFTLELTPIKCFPGISSNSKMSSPV